MKGVMSPGEMLFRVGIGVALVIVGLVLQAAWVSMVVILAGAALIGWTVLRAVRQVRRAEEIQRERRR